MVILENIDIVKAILQNIYIDKISNQFKFGISNRANSSSNMHGGNMHLCNVQSGNVQKSACTACNVQVGCMRHLHCTALDSCNDCSAISLHSGHVTKCIDRSRQKEAALYKVCSSLSAVLYRGNYLGAKADLLRVL